MTAASDVTTENVIWEFFRPENLLKLSLSNNASFYLWISSVHAEMMNRWAYRDGTVQGKDGQKSQPIAQIENTVTGESLSSAKKVLVEVRMDKGGKRTYRVGPRLERK